MSDPEATSRPPAPAGSQVNRWLLLLVVLLLLVEVARLVVGFNSSDSEPAAPAVAPAAVARTPSPSPAPAAPPAPASQAVANGDPLAPRLLDDREQMKAYLAAFPKDDYEIKEVAGLGKFYLDDIDDFIKRDLRQGKNFDPILPKIAAMVLKPGATVLDIGAHIGVHTLSLARIASPTGKVYAFEPQKKIYRELVHNLRLNRADNVVPLRFALGDRQAVIEMNPAPKGNEGGTGVGKGGDPAELRTVDSFDLRGVKLIKIDVEGFEDPVLRGARQTIAREKPYLMVEIMGGFNFDDAPPTIRGRIVQTIKLIEGMGYYVKRYTLYDYFAFPHKERKDLLRRRLPVSGDLHKAVQKKP